jgi:hypothetical protein
VVSIKHKAHRLADKLRHTPRDEHDLEAARLLERMALVYDVAQEMVFARTNEHSRAAYAEMIDLIKGKQID